MGRGFGSERGPGNLAGHSPVAVNLVHARPSILTTVSNTVVDVYAARLTRPARPAEAGEAAAVVQDAAASVDARLYVCRHTQKASGGETEREQRE